MTIEDQAKQLHATMNPKTVRELHEFYKAIMSMAGGDVAVTIMTFRNVLGLPALSAEQMADAVRGDVLIFDTRATGADTMVGS